MQMFIGKNGQQLGPFSAEEVQQKLELGELSSRDLAWREGMETWQPLATLFPGTSHEPPPIPAEPPPIPEAAPSAATPPHLHSSAPPETPTPQTTSGLAIGSLICGILGFMIWITCIPAVILGHVSLARIGKSHGSLGGRGMAVAGLVLGYLMIALLPIMAAIAIPAFFQIKKLADLTKASQEAREIVVAVQSYAMDHNGGFPPDLNTLAKENLINPGLLDCSLAKSYPGVTWVYRGAGLNDTAPSATVVLVSTTHAQLKKRVVARADGSVNIQTDAEAARTIEENANAR